jgi:hypothetical protein
MINQHSSDEAILQALKLTWKNKDHLAVVQHHDGISGTSTGYTNAAYSHNLFKSF